MTSTPRILTLIAAGALALGLSACTTTIGDPPPTGPTGGPNAALVGNWACSGDEGVTLRVDSSALDGGESSAWCFFTDEAVPAADALSVAKIETEGTAQYGDDVVCRVDGLPSASAPVGSTEDPAYVESCEAMPAAFAFWALWLKPAGGEWDYAQEGLSTLQVAPGDSLELLFTLDGAPAAPAA